VFRAVGGGKTVARAPSHLWAPILYVSTRDGLNWKEGRGGQLCEVFPRLGFGNGQFLVPFPSGRLDPVFRRVFPSRSCFSPRMGSTWEISFRSPAAHHRRVAWGNGRFVGVGDREPAAATASDESNARPGLRRSYVVDLALKPLRSAVVLRN